MPKIPTPCAEPGCPALTQGGRCRKHQRDRQRAQGRYQTLVWRRLRTAVLARDPICRECGRTSTTAAHIISRADGGEDTMDNLRGLCDSCHSSETCERDGGFGNPKREMIAR